MKWSKRIGWAIILLVPCVARAQSHEERAVEAASDVLREIMAIPAKAIPESLLADAQAVAIIPGMVKGGFVVGVRHGKGVVVMRNAAGEWLAPAFVSVSGGSVGLQAGLQSTDVIAVFRTRQGIDRLMRGKFTIGADLAVAAGPIGREASLATDVLLKAEILSYSRSRGLFVGVAIDGATMQVDQVATAGYYASGPGQPQRVPIPAVKLVEQIAAYAGPKKQAPINVKEAPRLPPPGSESDAVRAQLAESGLRLHHLLDPQWRDYLALPAEIYAEGKTPSRTALSSCLDRYGAVTADARYQSLTTRAEFRETHALLSRYRSVLDQSKSSALQLPPPPK